MCLSVPVSVVEHEHFKMVDIEKSKCVHLTIVNQHLCIILSACVASADAFRGYCSLLQQNAGGNLRSDQSHCQARIVVASLHICMSCQAACITVQCMQSTSTRLHA